VPEIEQPRAARLSDDQIDEMLRAGRPRKADPRLPSPRLPEALYYFILALFEAAVLMGIWGYMLRGINEVVTKGPRHDAGVWETVRFNFLSTFEGMGDQVVQRPWLVAAIIAGCATVFVPRTSVGRKRMVTLVTGIVVAAFATLIVIQFLADMNAVTSNAIY
jgi:hypothetical protein